MEDGKPRIRIRRPAAPGASDAFEVFGLGMSTANHLLGEGRLDEAVGPQAGPLLAIDRSREAPDAG